MTFKELLGQYRQLENAMLCTMEQIDRLKQLDLRSRSYLSAGGQARRTESAQERSAENLESLVLLLEKQVRSYRKKSEITRRLVARLDDMTTRMVMERHYFLGQTWETAAKKSYISVRRAYQLRDEAMLHLEERWQELCASKQANKTATIPAEPPQTTV